MGNKISKKMTNSTNVMCVFSVIALFFGAVGAAFDPLATLIHNAVFKHDVDYMFLYDYDSTVRKITWYFTLYGSSVFMAVMSLVVMILLFKNKGKKNLSSSTASLIIFPTLGSMLLPIFGMIDELSSSISKIKSSDTDQTVFIKVCQLLAYCIPLISGFFLLLTGLLLALRLSGESYSVAVERVEKVAPANEFIPQQMQNQPIQNQFAQPDMNSFRQPEPAAPVAPVLQPTAPESEPAVKMCPHCGAQLKSATAKFCSTCGQQV